VQNVGGLAALRIPSAVAQRSSCDIYGFVETMLADDTVTSIEPLLPGYTVWHCVRPRPARGRRHGGISVFVKRACAMHSSPGFRVTPDPAAGIMWVQVPAYQLTVAVCYCSPAGSAVHDSGVVHPDPVSALFEGLREAECRGHKHLVLGDLSIRIGRMISVAPCMAVPPALQEPRAVVGHHCTQSASLCTGSPKPV
jgi:hypothetical protein